MYTKLWRDGMGANALKKCAACLPNNRDCGVVLAASEEEEEAQDACGRCDEKDAHIAEKDARIADLEREVAELKWRLENE